MTLIKEEILADYHKLNVNSKKIKHPSQDFVKKIKSLNSSTKFNDKEWMILSAFKNSIEETIRTTASYKKKLFIVVPPSKDNKKNQMLELLRFLKPVGSYKIIEFASEDYSLKSMNKRERVKFFENSFGNWTINNRTVISNEESDSFFLFIDDIVTNRTTSHFTMKAVKYLYDLDYEPKFRTLYLLGTKSLKEYKENKKFKLVNPWKI